jgi:aspartate aminotransferase-like enzyme
MTPVSPTRLCAVTQLDVDRAGIAGALAAAQEALRTPAGTTSAAVSPASGVLR